MLKMTGIALAFGSFLLLGCGSEPSGPTPPETTTEGTGEADMSRDASEDGSTQELQGWGCAHPQRTGTRSARDVDAAVQCVCRWEEYPCGTNRDGSTQMCWRRVCGNE